MTDLKTIVGLIRINKRKSIKDLASFLDIGEKEFKNMIYGRKKVPPNVISRLKSTFLQENALSLDSSSVIMLVPLITKSAWAGFPNQFQDETYIESRDKVPMPATHEGKGEYLAFEIAGDSMDDGSEYSIKDGSRVYVRKVPSHYWKDGLRIKECPFILITNTGDIFLKRIYSMNKENGNVILKSQNVLYEDIQSNLNEIKAIYSVIHIMNKPLRY